MILFNVKLYPTNVVITPKDLGINIMLKFVRNLVSFRFEYNPEQRRKMRVVDREFYVKDGDSYRFPIGIMKHFMLTLAQSNVNKNEINMEDYRKSIPLVNNIEYKWEKTFILRDYQEQYRDMVLDPNRPVNLVDLQTGMGKSAIAANVIYEYKSKVCLLVLPRYVEKWVDDVKKYLLLKDDEICILASVKHIEGMSIKLKKDPTYATTNGYKVFILPMSISQRYMDAYEKGLLEYGCLKPSELMQALNISLLVNDEAHQHFHNLFRSASYYTVNKLVCLSATFNTNDPSIKKMQSILIPNECRIGNIIEKKVYTNVRAIKYRLSRGDKIRYTSAQGYHHVTLEQCILRNNLLMLDYFEMIDHYVKSTYINVRNEGERLLIFVATIDMGSILVNYLKRVYPNLKIYRYVENDPYHNILTGDITVTTLGKAGTGVDIKNLISVINTVSVSSLQSNLQSLGRLRHIEGREVWYNYFYCQNIGKQIKLHHDREHVIKSLAKNYRYEVYEKVLRN